MEVNSLSHDGWTDMNEGKGSLFGCTTAIDHSGCLIQFSLH